MKKICCTIITPDYLHKALTLFDSISSLDNDVSFFLLSTEKINEKIKNVEIISIEELSKTDEISAKLFEKYEADLDALRWSLKSVFIGRILKDNKESKVIYCDCDFCFFDSTSFLFNLVQDGEIVLTPHWRPLDPIKNSHNFKLNYRDGLFNAGCVAANYSGLEALNWWATACLSACENNREQGLYHDQRYLDLMPIYFPKTIICRHLGINIADWNIHLRTELCPPQQTVINKWPITAIHFTVNTIKKIESGEDPTLEPYLYKYKLMLENRLLHEKNNDVSYKLAETGKFE